VVFDALAPSTTGKSLNNTLRVGPTVQSDLISILLRFGTHRFVFTADVEKMYRQIWVHPQDKGYQLIVWRRSPLEKMEEAIRQREPICAISESAKLRLSKWCANHPELLKDIPRDDQALDLDFSKFSDATIKTLGIVWIPKEDKLQGRTKSHV